MNRRLLTLSALGFSSLLLVTGCGSSSSESSSGATTTSAAPAGSSTTVSTEAKATTTTGAPVTVKNATAAKYVNGPLAMLGLSVTERECVGTAADTALDQRPENAENQGFVAGVVAGAANSCAGKATIVKGLGQALRTENKYSDTQIECVEKELTAMDDQTLGTFVAYALVGADAEAKPMKAAIDAACGTKTAE